MHEYVTPLSSKAQRLAALELPMILHKSAIERAVVSVSRTTQTRAPSLQLAHASSIRPKNVTMSSGVGSLGSS